MWFAESRVRVWLYSHPTDMRRSFDGLSAMVKRELAEEPTDGSLYVFVNRRKTLMKVLYFETGGYCVWSKRLEQGQFQVRWNVERKGGVDLTALKLIIEGIDTRSVRHLKRYHHRREDRPLIAHPV
jgi:transposase